LPWLVLALWEVLLVRVLGYLRAMLEHINFFFTPLIAAMGNASCNYCARFANNTLSGSLFNRLIKEISLSFTKERYCLPFVLGSYFLLDEPPIIGLVICCALVSIIIASLNRDICALLLDKFG
jgi:magnesium transporter